MSTRIDLPAFIPAAVSVLLNSETGVSQSPFPLCGAGSWPNCWSVQRVRTGRRDSRCGKFARLPTMPHIHPYPGRWSLTGILTASSAAYGGQVVGALDSATTVQSLSAWAVPGERDPLRSGQYAVVDDADGLDENLCRSFAIIDGSFTDNTGISHAVGAGATELTAFLNAFLLSKWLKQGYEKSSPYAIFKDDILELIQTSRERRTIRNVTDAYAKIDFVRINATTKRNRLFDTKAGQNIKLNLIIIFGFLDESWYSQAPGSLAYGELLQSIVSAMTAPQHQESVEWVLKTFFHVSLHSG